MANQFVCLVLFSSSMFAMIYFFAYVALIGVIIFVDSCYLVDVVCFYSGASVLIA